MTAHETPLPSVPDPASEALIACTADDRILAWSAAATALLGHAVDMACGLDATTLVPASRRDEARRLAARALRGERTEEVATLRLHREGRLVPVALRVEPLRDANGAVVGTLQRLHDLAPHMRRERQAWQQLHLDPLTLLPNRRHLLDRLDHAVRTAERGRGRLAVVVFALRGLDAVERDAGRAAADAMRARAAQLLRAEPLDDGLAARLDDNRFALMLQGDAAPSIAASVAARLGAQLGAATGLAFFGGAAVAPEALLAAAQAAVPEQADAH